MAKRKTKGRYRSPDDLGIVRCAGTMDYKGYLRNVLNIPDFPNPHPDDIWVLDWKSAKDDYPEYRMQTAKYREMDGEANRNGIVLLDKETGFPRFIDHSDTYEEDIARFNLLLEYWYLTYGDRLKDGYVPSPTEILDILNKPALVWWSVNCMRDYLFEKYKEWDERIAPGISKDYLFAVTEEARKNFRKVSEKALDIGSAVHDLIPRWLTTRIEPKIDSEPILAAFMAFLEFEEKYGLEFIDLEKTVYGGGFPHFILRR